MNRHLYIRYRALAYLFFAFGPALFMQFAPDTSTFFLASLVYGGAWLVLGIYLSFDTLIEPRLSKRAVIVPLFMLYVGVVACGIPTATLSWQLYLGGKWETLPWLNQISGQQRFELHVRSPVPQAISNIQGGYTGYPHGEVITHFEFSGEFAAFDFLRNWWQVDSANSRKDFLRFAKAIEADEFYKSKTSDTFLFVSKEHKKGILFVPWYELH